MMDVVVTEMERILTRVNDGLKSLLKKNLELPAFNVRKALVELERLSRWKREYAGSDWMAKAIEKAEAKAKEYGEPTVVVKALGGSKLIVVTRKRFKEDLPFGATERDIIYTARKKAK
jgi:hypothetical protein